MGLINRVRNIAPIKRVYKDLNRYGHAIIVLHKAGQETQYVVWDYGANNIAHGREMDPLGNIVEVGLGHQVIHVDTGQVKHIPTEDRRDLSIENTIYDILTKIMHDEEICVFKTENGKEFFITHTTNINHRGFSVYHRPEPNHTVGSFIEWATLKLHWGKWFPYGYDFTRKEGFVYYPWMGTNVRDTSVLPIKVEAPTIDSCITDIRNKLELLESLLTSSAEEQHPHE